MFNSFKASAFGRFTRQFRLSFVREAHKKAGGSKTHMQDSAGKRLGPKKHEGQEVKRGQIIMRQRGTNWYPGTNVGIGKDHTLFALEPGYVRYYLDPFHPKRKFIGIVLGKEDRLPYEHFAATHRRLGRRVIKNTVASQREEEYMSRKEQLIMPDIMKEKQARDQKRAGKVAKFQNDLPKFVGDLSTEELAIAAQRMNAIDGFMRGGKSLEDGRFYATYNYNYETDLSCRARKEISEAELESRKQEYAELAKKVDDKVMLDARFQLCKYLDAQQREERKKQDIEQLKTLIPDANKPVDKRVREKAMELIDDSCFSLSEQIHLKRRFLKPVLPESEELLGDDKTKHAIVISRMNYDTRRVDTIYRKKEGFLK
ncbi:hypothetical protein FOA43_002021 [Brettanomyces nanus]|uniref:Large ribosomal subunit protein bL27m n=1 Tax=Eeniella nana TaxID=13502 RepID=A0A875S152_EENNA|nr:uncharacterized protein FOA43_002021 [Brettanomyces nanus]QPG74688.1 hypothetical protein FOA43_002021 [Brettanomyces nanus]